MNGINNYMRKDYLISAAALTASLYIYTVYRTDKIIVNQIIEWLSQSLYNAIIYCRAHRVTLPGWMIFSLPEGLWIFSVTILSGNLCLNIGKTKLYLYYGPILYAVALEFLQFFQVTNGRFDMMDILISISFWALALIYQHNKHKQLISHDNKFQKALILTCYSLLYLSDVISYTG